MSSKLKQPNQNTWLYTDIVKDHFFNPRNVQYDEPRDNKFNGKGTVGSPVCGDMMTMWIKVDEIDEKIKKCTWKTFGCASAIASTSILSEMVTKNGGMKITDAMKITPKDIIKELGGLPARKIHCSVLGDQALRAAIENYRKSA
ncbi:hypothetical protein COV56_02845 [Candidatus Kuenenbacteria bacterium CG11_big_fil_rev_8_21_14_0_20_37_9]|uniref:NIF system FeS cluster assembly NifU N-terminal domain-containing protein n=2 Tax=Candidatus Kueneniibacteriota TaxID=1752740 RepID=A0A2M6XRX0_9BACT|nr:MAG: hypothetical protein AUJ29_01075 [Candidatus Kuenenbacteria bacterium CG1_02_38_13]PIR05449.1 MAG: hypothetical protein COV56_02845 [Candidatus Kuenenbacteria bacterium CG11_big_fil_rev_8_21_14_0_20_37_9]PIU10392.1 MAG: hypothetical protein COT27_03405 [Candidatus Kuenenbacteria bacterium CG08_land_8_20_14_0_20_37_23]